MAMQNRISFHTDTKSLFQESGVPKLYFRALRINQIDPQVDWYNIGGDIAFGRCGEITPHSTS
jgi:hypothetical protein